MRAAALLLVPLLAGCVLPTDQGSGGDDGSGIEGIVMLGPQCPVQQDPPEPECDDKPYQTRLAATAPGDDKAIKEFESGEDGRFRVTLGPGEYTIRAADPDQMHPYCRSDTIRVRSGNYTETTVYCDTGIRF